jgi:hypothetical protein
MSVEGRGARLALPFLRKSNLQMPSHQKSYANFRVSKLECSDSADFPAGTTVRIAKAEVLLFASRVDF